ncbi:MAG: DNA polymerase III subunit delta [Ghiorsea sp.]|nr:DNA polymerase III subunit delta [Ghiorsea sp.]
MNKVLGHEHVQSTFSEAMQQNRLHHAWLFYGVKGIGKASVAEQMAALFLCESPDLTQNKACGQCHHCAMLHVGSHPDFSKVSLLYDQKKKKFNRDINISQTREALGFLALSGLKSKRRVLMIDDANLMNNQAANALLKGLEEPTEGSLLLIVCHDLMRLPATIRSRCMLQACSPLNPKQMQQVLQMQGFDEKLLPLATELGQGSLGRIEVLQEKSQAEILLAWQSLVEDLSQSDIGLIQQWLDSHVKNIPHDLIVSVVLIASQKHAAKLTSWQQSDAVFSAMLAVAKWPKEVVMHTLRPAPALMAYLLQLRSALKTRV